jgi:inorganic pyrophosphatase
MKVRSARPESAVPADLGAGVPELDVVIEVPRGSHLKRDWAGRVRFVSPLPCPFNYGAVPTHIGLEGDLLDALVLGPRLELGARIRVKAWGAVTLTDRGMSDDKLVCSTYRPSAAECGEVERFFHFYARCKAVLNFLLRRPGRNACDGWRSAAQALSRARLRDDRWSGPPVGF